MLGLSCRLTNTCKAKSTEIKVVIVLYYTQVTDSDAFSRRVLNISIIWKSVAVLIAGIQVGRILTRHKMM